MENSKIDPLKLVPHIFERYVWFPRKLACVCIVLFVFGTVGLSFIPHESTSIGLERSSIDSSSSPIVISVSSPFDINYTLTPNELSINQGPYFGYKVVKNSEELYQLFNAQGGIVATLQKRQGDEGAVVEIIDAAGHALYTTKPDDDGYKILDAERALITKVKFKEEKFNIYDASGKRLYYGKNKKGSILIRDDGGSDLAWVVASPLPSLPQIAPLCLPIQQDMRALLFMNALSSTVSQ